MSMVLFYLMEHSNHNSDASLFEIIDQKQYCKSIYCDNRIVEVPDYGGLSKTWAYHSTLKGYDIKYASLYAKTRTLDECCPDELKKEWSTIKKKYSAYIKSFQTGFCELDEECFYDLVPHSFVLEYFNLKSQITEHVLSTTPEPKDYSFLVALSELLTDIRDHKLLIEPKEISNKLHETKARSFFTKLHAVRPFIDYNMFGTITGRLTTHKNSFPLLTMSKDYRRVVKPTNTWFIELDFNAAELRCLLALNDQEQPEQDMHDWHGSIFNRLSDHKLSRDDIKRKIFGWLYGPLDASLGIPQVQKHYDKRKVLNKYWDGNTVVNPFGRKIIADEFHALNAVIQSTTSDIFLRRAIAVNKLLENKKSFTMGLIHDSMVIDFHREDKDLIDEIIKEFGDTDLGKFKVNTSLGTHFGNLKRFR